MVVKPWQIVYKMPLLTNQNNRTKSNQTYEQDNINKQL